MFTKEKDYIGIGIEEDSLRFAHIKLKGQDYKVINVVRRDIRNVSDEDKLGIARQAIAELNVKRADAICAIPSSLVTTKNIEIPSLDPEEIASIIDLQAGRHTPYSREEILIGYVTIGVFQRNYTKILLAIVNREAIKKQLDFLESAGAKIERVLFAPEGVARFYSRVLNAQAEDVPVGVIDVGNQVSNFTIEYNQTVATCRCIPIGMDQLIKEGPAAQERLLKELLNSVESYQNEDIGTLPETYVLSSDDAKVKELQPMLQEKMKANVKVMPYLDHIKADQSIMLKLVSEYNDDSFLSVIAAVLSASEAQVDLTPEEIKTQRIIEEKGRQAMRSAGFAVVLLFLVCGIFFSKIYFKSIFLDKLKKEYVKKRRVVISLDKIAQKTRIIKDYLNSRMVSLDVIEELYLLMPDEIYLQSILLDENGTINIQGISESMSLVFNFVSSLEDSEVFKSVKTRSTTAKKDRGKDVAAFEISFKLESAKDDPKEELDEMATEEEVVE